MFVSAGIQSIFEPLISLFQQILIFFHANLGLSWGMAIILLTVCVRGVMLPLAIKQYQSMRRLQVHQPEMKRIQKQWKADKQRQQQEMMKFYKENHVNPLGSCLPMVLQLPVFFALFYAFEDNLRKDICPGVQAAWPAKFAALHHVTLQQAIGQTTPCGAGFHGASFLFINDLTNKATGIGLIVLLVLYVGSQMASTQIMAGPTMQGNQRWMMLLMPIFFVIFYIHFPAGLMLYWVASNFWTMGQQGVLRLAMGAPKLPEPAPGEPPDEPGEGLMAQVRGFAEKLAGQRTPATATAHGDGVRPRSSHGAVRHRPPDAPPPRPPRKHKKRSGRRR